MFIRMFLATRLLGFRNRTVDRHTRVIIHSLINKLLLRNGQFTMSRYNLTLAEGGLAKLLRLTESSGNKQGS